jgi:hypothetical protein
LTDRNGILRQSSGRVDLGFADREIGTNDLLRRLAGWSTTWNQPVRTVQFGIEDD